MFLVARLAECPYIWWNIKGQDGKSSCSRVRTVPYTELVKHSFSVKKQLKMM